MRAVNLIPSEARGDAGLGGGRSGGGAYAVLGLLAGLTLLVLLYGIARHQVSSRRSEVAAINARAQRATENDGQLSKYTSFVALHQERMQAVTQLANSRFAWAHSMYELGRVLPQGVSIASLSGSVGTASEHSSGPPAKGSSAASAPAVASATPPGSVPTFTLTGCATSQPTVAVMLTRLSLIHGVAEATLQASSSSSGGGAGGGGGGASSHSCPPGAPTFTVLVTYQPLAGGGATGAPSSSSSLTSDVGGTTLQKAQSTGGGG